MIPSVSTAPVAAGDTLFEPAFRARLEPARDVATAELLSQRTGPAWTGELSSSALSTATAVTALTLHARGCGSESERKALLELARGGIEWLVTHQNADGGWGDTVESISNISTTTLVWAALGLAGEGQVETARAVSAAEQWLRRIAGSLEPASVVRAIEDCYGADRTFSIPILTMCALCGRLGGDRKAWKRVRQLPFEVAALPQRWFATLRLPVVSYALPALIAIGQVRHGKRPTRNLPFRWLRNRCRRRTLRKLVQLQPENGGFLEATPLTSFVVMSLAALGLNEHVVVRRGVSFLRASVRGDGSWPIDTNLATWVTTLAVNALRPNGSEVAARSAGVPPASDPSRRDVCATGQRGTADGAAGSLSKPDAVTIRDWLLQQQYRTTHPYTLAAPGGWAWTNLPGGVPDADDTAGALLALHRLDADGLISRGAAANGITWLLDLQNRDGGIPTFCRGWGKLPFDRSSPDLTAHAIRAWLAWRALLDDSLGARVDTGLLRAARFLARIQTPDGTWVPLWFGHQQHPRGDNPVYGTARVIPALCDLEHAPIGAVNGALDRALAWLAAVQNFDGGWSAAPGAASSAEETAVALEAISAAWVRDRMDDALRAKLAGALRRGAEWVVNAIETDRWRTPSPIGLYFAKLWYHERLYPVIFATGALVRLAELK